MPRVTRRELLRAGAAGSAVLCLGTLMPRGAESVAASSAAAAEPSAYGSFDDLYRRAWRWDRVVRGTHLRANCFSACAFDLYVRDGVVWREEQADVYARDVQGLPDYAPRGCQKGACYSSLMLSPERITHPLERVGPRGSGRWRRISWDDALTKLADSIVEAVEEGGPETVVYDNGTSNVDNGPSSAGEMRLFQLLGATMLDGFGGTGDLAMGAFQSWGTSFVDGSADDWLRSKTLILWHVNPASTRIPDAHFLTEARYRGTEVVCIAPDHSPSALHTSLWVNPHPGTDAALALGLSRDLLERGAIDADYVREQTDLPFLVREDTGRLLRAEDFEEGGADDLFYVWDEKRDALARAPGTMGSDSDSIDLGSLRPALDGRFEVETRDGKRTVRTVLDHLRTRLAEYTPERVEQITGVAPSVQRHLADRVGPDRRTLVYASWGSNKSYHADLLHRSMILLSALGGHHGRPGGGVRFAAWLPFSGSDELFSGPQGSWLQRLVLKFWTPPPRMIENAIAAASPHMAWTPSHLFLHAHGGLDALQDDDLRDDALPRPPRAYLDEALEKGWLAVRPARDNPPRVFVASGVNPLRRWPAPQRVREVLWPKLRTIAVVDFRMSSTAAQADLLLPAAGYYEKRGIKYAVAIAPYVVPGDQAVAPLGESRGEWEIFSRLAQRIQERATERGLKSPLATLGDRFSLNGRFGPEDDAAVADGILRLSSISQTGFADGLRKGAIPVRTVGGWGATSGIGSEVEDGGTLTPSRVHVEDKHAWPTLTGRQQIYLDHPWFMDADEALPRYKPLPRPGGDHPIRLTGGHTRWSIHAIWRAHPEMLRLQRGVPCMWMAADDARARGIRDGESVRVRNDHGSFEIATKVSAGVAPGEAIVYHAWEPYQFPGWRGNMEVVSSPYKPLHLVGDYGHLRYRLFHAGPVHVPRGVPVEIERMAV